MRLEISSGKATTPAAWLIRPPQVMSDQTTERVLSLRAAKNETSLFGPQRGCDSMLRLSSAAATEEESLMMSLSFSLISCLLGNQSD